MQKPHDFALRLYGEWKDTIHYRDGRVVEGGWRRNQIQNLAPRVAAIALSRFGELSAGAGYTGISYLACGEGSVSWDSASPTQDPNKPDLHAETFRKAVGAADMAFLDESEIGDAAGPVTVVSTPSRVIRVQVTLDYAEANGPLREFALFGGNATATADSGHIFNWVVHGLINKDSSMRIARTIRIILLEP